MIVYEYKWMFFGICIKKCLPYIWFRVTRLHPFSGRTLLKAFSDLQPLTLQILSHICVEVNLSLTFWRQIDGSR